MRRENEGQQQLSMLAHSVWDLSLHIFSLGAELRQVSRRNPDHVLALWGGKASAEPQCLWACESGAEGRWGQTIALDASTFCVGAITGCLHLWSWAPAGIRRYPDGMLELWGCNQIAEPQSLWDCERGAKGRGGPTRPFKGSTFSVGAICGRVFGGGLRMASSRDLECGWNLR